MKLKLFELALAAALVVTAIFSAGVQQEQTELSQKLIRLHIVANSDSEADQTLKLQVRDRVSAQVSALVAGAESAGQAEAILRENLEGLARTAAEGHDYPVRVSLQRENFPTRDYESFSLAAGEYETLRVVLGAGEGHNWWCVLFPPLCTDACLDDAGLEEEEQQLLTGERPVRFKTLELLDWLRRFFSGAL